MMRAWVVRAQKSAVKTRSSRSIFVATLAFGLLSTLSSPADEPSLNNPPTARDWAKLSKLPDWSGVWNPNISDQNARIKTDPVPWKPEAEARINHLVAEEYAMARLRKFPESRPGGALEIFGAFLDSRH